LSHPGIAATPLLHHTIAEGEPIMATKSSTKKSTHQKSTTPPSRRWSAKVQTDSTKPSAGLFKKSAKAIATELASKKDSPKGPAQAMQMLNFYENRAGKNLSAERKHTLERAKELLHDKVEEKRGTKSTKKKAS
jgi:tRNA(adenine34) deaminase